MKLRRMLLPILLVASSCLTGCGSHEAFADTYIEGSDHQYMRMGILFFPNFQKGEKGYYFMYNDFIYFLDDEKEEIVPLCSRADCLHDKETDPAKLEYCNAYIPRSDSTGIAYCNGWLYYLDPGFYGSSPVLYRIHADGSGKEEIYRWQSDGAKINQWIVHRDVIYYMTQTYSTGKEDIKGSYAAFAMPLTGSKRFIPQQIYQSPEEGVDIVTLGNPTAYGNHVYFMCLGNLDGWDGSDDNWMEYSYNKAFEYNILTEELSEISLMGQAQKTSMIQLNTFWKDKLVFSVYDHQKDSLDNGPFYIANLDGTDAELLMTAKQGYSLFGDGKYLYLSNVNLNGRGKDPSSKLYRVFDGDLNEVDTFTVGEETYYDFPIGLPDRAYGLYVYQESGVFGIRYWDKSAIGSLNGAEITYTEIPYAGSMTE